MLAALAAALVLANTGWSDGYVGVLETHVGTGVRPFDRLTALSIRELVNDAAMVWFFAAVGLEVRRELTVGELSDRRSAALPVVAAIGGVVVPALIYLMVTIGTPAVRGWGVPMATDVPLAVGVVALLGRRVPLGAKVLLLAFAIVDDIVAIVVVAVGYPADLEPVWFLLALAGAGCLLAAWRSHREALVLVALGSVALWLGLLEAGVAPAVSGVAIAIALPPARLESAERVLSPLSSYVAMPLFALANGGIALGGDALGAVWTTRVGLGIVLGQVIGKPLGIAGACWLAVRTKYAQLPPRTTMRHVIGVGLVGGIGFTVALLIALRAFTDPADREVASSALLTGGVLAGSLGYLWLRLSPRSGEDSGDAAESLDDGVV